ncbi:MAG: hypothetical protein V3U93_09320 [Alphaproteobacteria bacterium]
MAAASRSIAWSLALALRTRGDRCRRALPGTSAASATGAVY